MALRPDRDQPEVMTTTQRTRTTTTTTRDGRGITVPVVRCFLLLDAGTTGVHGLAYATAGGWLADLFGAAASLVRSLGVFLLVVAAGVAVSRPVGGPPPRRAALAALNVVWVVASLVYAVLGGLTTLGLVWTVLQALSSAPSPPARYGWRGGADAVTTMTLDVPRTQQRRPTSAHSSGTGASAAGCPSRRCRPCGVSTRHLSYIETGKAGPSPTMVGQLGEALAVPLRERRGSSPRRASSPTPPSCRSTPPRWRRSTRRWSRSSPGTSPTRRSSSTGAGTSSPPTTRRTDCSRTCPPSCWSHRST